MIKVSNSNGSAKYKDAVRVYRHGLLVGEVFPTKRNPLAYLKAHPKSKYNVALVDQLKQSGLTDEEIAEVYA